MVDANLEQWFELKKAKKQVPLKEQFTKLQEQQTYQLASLLAEHLEQQAQNLQAGPPTPPPTAPSSQVEPASEPFFEPIDEDRQEPDRETLTRLLDLERMEEERTRRNRIAAAKRAALPRTRPIPTRQCSQPSGIRTRQSESRAVSAQEPSQPRPETPVRPPLPLTRTVGYQTENGSYQQDTERSPDLTPSRQKGGNGLFDTIYQSIIQVINNHVEEFANEMQALKTQMMMERAHRGKLEHFLKDKFGVEEQDFARLWDTHERMVQSKEGLSRPKIKQEPVERVEQQLPRRSRRCDSVLPSVENRKIRIKQEHHEDKDDVEDGVDGSETEREEQDNPEIRRGPLEAIFRTPRVPSAGQKRKADDDAEEEGGSQLKRPTWVQAVSPVPNPHLRSQAKQLITVRKSYREGGSRNPLVLE